MLQEDAAIPQDTKYVHKTNLERFWSRDVIRACSRMVNVPKGNYKTYYGPKIQLQSPKVASKQNTFQQ